MAASIAQREGKKSKSLKDFKGVNTQASRQSIGEDEFAWLENVIPIGFGNMVAVPAPSGSLATWTGTAYYQQSASLNGVDYMYVFTTNGAAYQINLNSYAVTTVANSSTFNGSGTVIAQWENTQIVIVDPTNGYFTWDGATLTKWNGTIQSLTITALGSGYTSQPTIGGFGTGGGSGGAATCDIQVGLISLDPSGGGGIGYAVGDVITLTGGSFNTAAQVTVSSVNGSGTITGFNLTNTGDYTSAPANPVNSTGGYGTGAHFQVNFGIGPITLTNIGSGYSSAPTITVTGGGGTGGAVRANLSVVPSVGTSVATYSGRVWVGNGRTVVFSAPTSYNDFTSSNAGGSFIMVDETLHSTIISMVSANNFLYIVGSTSINALAGVTVVNGITVFTNTNISANIGSNQPNSIVPYYRALWFAAPYGFYGLYGTTPQKGSDALDGVFPLISNSQQITAGTVIISNIMCLAFLFKYNDPVNGTRSLMAIYFNKKWFFSSQGNSINFIASALVGGQPTLYGNDGSNLYKLFSQSSVNISQTIQTKLWDMGDSTRDKQAIKLGVEIITPATPEVLSGTVDTEITGGQFPFQFNAGNTIIWQNNASQSVTWQNNLLQNVVWLSAGYSFQKTNVETTGKYLGITINATTPGEVYSGLHLQYEERAHWTSLP